MGSMFKRESVGDPRYLRMGFFGGQGSGKSVTAMKTAIGLTLFTKGKKDIAMFDTENGSAWLKPLCDEHNVGLSVLKTTSYNQFTLALQNWWEHHDILIVDSIVHYFEAMVSAYLRARPWLKSLNISSWGELKPKWRDDVVRPLLQSKGHVILCSREAQVWKDEETDEMDERTGKFKKKATRKGERPAGDSQLGYEVDLLVQMTKELRGEGGLFWHTALVVKDKNPTSTTLEGKSFRDPGFKEWLPHITSLGMKEGKLIPVDYAPDEQVFEGENEERRDAYTKRQRRDAAYEEIVNLLKEMTPRKPAARNALLEALFGTTALDTSIKDDFNRHTVDKMVTAVHVLRKIRDTMTADDIDKIDTGEAKKIVTQLKNS